MDEFEEAQRLFSIYERTGSYLNLRDAVEVLKEMIADGQDVQRATNLKNTICRHIDSEIDKIIDKCNIAEFVNTTEDMDSIRNLLAASLSNDDCIRLMELLGVKVEIEH